MNMPTDAGAQLDQAQQERLLTLAVKREVSRATDGEAIQTTVAERAKLLTEALAKGGLTARNMAQVRNLENIAYSTEKVSDITDYVKQQIGRSPANQRWRYKNVGHLILTDLSQLPTEEPSLLRAEVQPIAEQLNRDYPDAADADLPRRIHLALCRQYVRHLAAHYLYVLAQNEDGND